MPIAAETVGAFGDLFPRLYQLKNAVPDPSHPNAYFQHFEERLNQSEHVRQLYSRVERSLQVLDDASWLDLLQRATPLTMQRDAKRGWQALFDTLNESKGYAYLASLGCSNIRFIPRATKKTPDLRAILDAKSVLCEVKTINVSQEEADRRERIHQGDIFATRVSNEVAAGLLEKVRSTVLYGIEQLDYQDPHRMSGRIVFTVLHFDDWVGDYQAEYIAQLDAHLTANPVTGAELVVCPASNLFERKFAMQSAVVVEI